MATHSDSSTATWAPEPERVYREAWLRRLSQNAPLVTSWILAPRALLAAVQAEASGHLPCASLCFLTWDAGCEALAEQLLLPEVARADSLDLQEAIAHALTTSIADASAPGALADAFRADPLGVPAALAPAVAALFEGGVPAEAADESWPALVKTNIRFLVALKGRIQEDLTRRGLATSSMRWEAVAEALEEGPVCGLPDVLMVDGVDHLDAARWRAIAQLRRLGVEVILPPWLKGEPVPEQDHESPAIALWPMRDPDDESALAVRWVRTRLQEGHALDRLAVMVPPGAGYEPLLARALGAAGFNVHYTEQVAISGMPEFQALRAFVRLKRGRVDVIDLVTLLKLSEAVRDPAFQRLVSWLYEHLPNQWERVIALVAKAGLAPEVEATLTAALRRLAAPARDRLEAIEDFWSDWAPEAPQDLLAAIERAQRAYQQLAGAKATLSGLPAALERLCGSLVRHHRPGGGAVEILTAGPYAPFALDALLVLGFNDGCFPRGGAAPALLGPLEVGALREAGYRFVPSRTELAAYEMRNAWRMLDLAPRIDVAFPERSASGGKLRPSPLVEILRRQGAQEGQGMATGDLSRWEWTRQAASALGAGEALPQGLTGLAARGEAEWLTACLPRSGAWRVAPETVKTLLGPLSPTALETMLQCGFGFYARSLLRLKELPPARAIAWDAATSGSIKHRVLEVLLEDTPDGALDTVDFGPVVAKVLATDFPALDAAAHRLELDWLKRDLERFAKRYAALARDLGATGGDSEWRFGWEEPVFFPLDPAPEFEPLRQALGGDAIRVTGLVDRVLLREGRPIGIDFKSGDVGKYPKQRSLGLGAQVAVYSWAIAQRHAPPEAFMYLTLGDREPSWDVVPASDAALTERVAARPELESLEKVESEFRRALTERLMAIAEGHVVPVTPERAAEFEGAKAHPCKFCTHDLLCREKKS